MWVGGEILGNGGNGDDWGVGWGFGGVGCEKKPLLDGKLGDKERGKREQGTLYTHVHR